jgi:hypothetical protein
LADHAIADDPRLAEIGELHADGQRIGHRSHGDARRYLYFAEDSAFDRE